MNCAKRKISFFSVLAMTLKKTINISQWTHASACKKYFFRAEISNTCDWRITETLKENHFYEQRAFYHLNQRIVPNKTLDIVFPVLATIHEHRCRRNHPLLARAVAHHETSARETRFIFLLTRNSVIFQNFHFSDSRETRFSYRETRVASLHTRISSREMRLSSREKRDETGNLL